MPSNIPASDPSPELPAPALGEEDPLPSLDLALPKRRLWPVLSVFALILGAVAFFVWRSLTAPFPTRVLVAVDMNGTWWEGSKEGAKLADDLSRYLEQLGLEPVRAGDPEVEAILEDTSSPEEAAKKLRAAWIITGTVKLETVKLPLPDKGAGLVEEVGHTKGSGSDYVEVRAEASLELRHLDEEQPVAPIAVHTFSGARSEERALDFVAGSVARHVVHEVMPAVMRHESIEALKSDPKLFDAVAKGKGYATSVTLHREQAQEAYDNLATQRKKEPLAFVSPIDSEDRLLAVTGEGVLVATSDARPFFTPDGQTAIKTSDLETIRMRPFDGAEGKTFWRGYQAFTYPSAAPSGAPVALIENFYGFGRALTLVDAGASPRRLLVTDSRISEPRMSPSGKAVAFVERKCKQCPTEIVVLDVVGGKELWRLESTTVIDVHHAFRWLDERRLLVMYRRAMDPEEADVPLPVLVAVDVTTGERESLLELEEGYPDSLAASPDSTRLALADRARRSVLVLTIGGPSQRHDVGAAVSSLVFSPDGGKLAFDANVPGRRGQEIGVLDFASGKTTFLTNNAWDDKYPLFSPDGRKVFFEARNDDPALPRRELIRIASLPVP